VNNITEHFDARARLRRFLGNGKCPAHAEAKPPGFGHIYFHRTTSCMGIRNCCSNELAIMPAFLHAGSSKASQNFY
jgi:hypothetical protein